METKNAECNYLFKKFDNKGEIMAQNLKRCRTEKKVFFLGLGRYEQVFSWQKPVENSNKYQENNENLGEIVRGYE